MKRILITGGAGFIGSHLCRRLVNEGHDVVCLDNYYTGSKANVSDLLDKHNFELVRHDVIQEYYAEVDQIYNLACPASPVHYQSNPIKTAKTSFLGTLNMLGLAKRTKARLLQASTSEIYGNPEVHPQNESYFGNVNTVGPRSCYDEGKRVAETLVMDYHRLNGLDTRIVRIFNTYGPNMHINDGRVVSNFIVQALKGDNITMYGDGTQTRSFCYCDDLVAGLIKLMNKEGLYSPVNIGNPSEITIKTLAEEIINITGSDSKIVFKALPQDDPERGRPDITKAKNELGWGPKINLKEGLTRTIEYFEKILKDKKNKSF